MKAGRAQCRNMRLELLVWAWRWWGGGGGGTRRSRTAGKRGVERTASGWVGARGLGDTGGLQYQRWGGEGLTDTSGSADGPVGVVTVSKGVEGQDLHVVLLPGVWGWETEPEGRRTLAEDPVQNDRHT